MTDEVAIATKAKENIVFSMASSLQQERSKFSQTKHDFIHACSFNGEQCDIERDFALHIDPIYGNCFTFNHNRSVSLRNTRVGALCVHCVDFLITENA